MSEHRLPLLSDILRRYPDPEHSTDPGVLTLLADLRSVEFAPLPRAEFRGELRAQLVAVAPRIIAEGLAEDGLTIGADGRPTPITAIATAPQKTKNRTAPVTARRSFGRPLALMTCIVAAFAVLLGGAVWMSKKAVPGDTLYGLKRASENVQLSLTSDPRSRAQDYLEFAANRAAEAQTLLSRASALGGSGALSGAVSATTAQRVVSVLNSADADVRSASSLLGQQAVKSGSPTATDPMTAWAPAQRARLTSLALASPDPQLRSRALTSAKVVQAADTRAKQLSADAGNSCLRNTGSDSLGPRPCGQAVRPGSSGTGHSTKPGGVSTRSATTGVVPGQPGTTGRPGGTHTSAGRNGSTTTAGQPSASVPVHLPTLPTSGLPSLPISVSTCGVTVGPVHLALGSCTSSAN